MKNKIFRNLTTILVSRRHLLCGLGFFIILFWWSTPAYADEIIFDEFPDWLPVDENDPYSIAWGDVDGDGDLDLAVGNNGVNRVYENQQGMLEISASWTAADNDQTESVAWGDVDGDGDLDLAVGNRDQPNRVYENVGGVLDTTATWTSAVSNTTLSVAWGDVNGDGYLDLAVGNDGENKVYVNLTGTLETTANWTSVETDTTTSVAWGDVNNDGDLDLVVGNLDQPNVMYENLEGNLENSASWHSLETDPTESVALGDMDEDGDLDLVVGNGGGTSGASNRVYYNEGGKLNLGASWSSVDGDSTQSVAWGDMDGDGDLDLAVGNIGALNKTYENMDGTLSQMPYWSSGEMGTSHSVAWGDMDGDGNLDLTTANSSEPVKVYLNSDTVLETMATWTSPVSDTTRSVAWGDMDGDGDLDLAVGNDGQSNRVYGNDNGTLETIAIWTSVVSDATTSVAWGDVDGDGDLDLAVGNDGQANNVYEYVNGVLNSTAAWTSAASDATQSIAWGDVDGDGDLDLAVGNDGQTNKVYENIDGALETTATWTSSDSDATQSIVWGDVDNDGDLDLAVGNDGQANKLYENVNGVLGSTAVWSCTVVAPTSALAWGDMDGDGDLDLAVANVLFPNQVYENVDGVLATDADWMSTESSWTSAIAWGDMDGDGDLDLLAGNDMGSVVYENDQGALPAMGTPIALGHDGQDIAWGDVDSDGDLDLAMGNASQNKLYLNTRNIRVSQTSVPRLSLSHLPYQADFYAMADVVADPVVPITYTLEYPDGYPPASSEAFYSLNGGGQWLSAVTATDTVVVETEIVTTTMLVNRYPHTDEISPSLVIPELGTITSTLVLTPSDVIVDLSVRLWFTHTDIGDLVIDLISPLGTKVSLMNQRGGPQNHSGEIVFDDKAGASISTSSPPFTGTYRSEDPLMILDGQPLTGTWKLVIRDVFAPPPFPPPPPPSTGTLINWGLETVVGQRGVQTSTKTTNVYQWDVLESGVLGQSDNVVFRMRALPAISTTANAVPGPYLYGSYGANGYPFRLRGSQVRVMSGTSPISNALVYHLPVGYSTGGDLITDDTGTPFRTNVDGYLQGRGEIGVGDQLVALLPITWTESYTLYYTNGTPTSTGIDVYEVSAQGVQTITVSADNPIILFDLDVSLEWDAHNDEAYLEQLEFNLRRASEYLYDFTNGQVAVGNINVFQNADEWVYSHIVVQANNRLRPFAAQGGIVVTDTVDPHHNTVTDTILYSPGQLTMGSNWNRYGNPGQSLGDDWSIILAHELGHYLLFHDDVYLGMDENGYLISVDTCYGSAMGDLYSDPDNTEFIAKEDVWQTQCADTLAEQTLGRNEWETMQLWYPELITPTTVNAGPSIMPFDFTDVSIHDPYTPTDTLIDPTFYIDYEDGGSSSSEARAYLDRDLYVINLGSPYGGQNRVVAHGAKPGDRLCVFDRSQAQFGCETVEEGDNRLTMRQDQDWNPIIQLNPVNSTTLTINVTNTVPITHVLWARIFPDLSYGEDAVSLTLSGGVYTGTFDLTYPAMNGNIQVWVDETDTEAYSRREAMVAYSIGGNSGYLRGGGGYLRGGGGYLRGGGGYLRGGGGYLRGGGAPIVSPDGQMTFFTQNPVDFEVGTFFTIQGMAGLPSLPPGRTLVGQGYNLVTSPGVTMPIGSVSIQYLSNDVLVAGATENDLMLYFWDGNDWLVLNTVLDTYFNLASAPSQGEGVYALMASVRIPLYGPGWNNIAYPVQETQPVSEALLSISGYYTTVYGYEPTDVTNPWRVYDVTAPSWVNDLDELEFGNGYWINVSQGITLYLASDTSASSQSVMHDQPPRSAQSVVSLPPATFYGMVSGDQIDFVPTVGMEVTAWISGTLCGQGQTLAVNDQVAYTVNVFAAGANTHADCGVLGRIVSFRVEGYEMGTTATWNNHQLWQLMLTGVETRVYLPLVIRLE
ncbi:MAG: hypothetical protein GY832_44355 [Chloroflexi bacterium]|nr:hypothetical protein [Chloroflexota bacterium]